jgi:hypothetical protein
MAAMAFVELVPGEWVQTLYMYTAFFVTLFHKPWDTAEDRSWNDSTRTALQANVIKPWFIKVTKRCMMSYNTSSFLVKQTVYPK